MKKFLSIISLVLVLSFVLCGCEVSSNSNNRKKAGGKDEGENESTAETEFSDIIDDLSEQKDNYYDVEGFGIYTDLHFNRIFHDPYATCGVYNSKIKLVDSQERAEIEIDVIVAEYTSSSFESDREYSPDYFDDTCEEALNLDDMFETEIAKTLQGTPLLIAKSLDCDRILVHTYTDEYYYDIEVILYVDDRAAFEELCEDLKNMVIFSPED